MASLSPLSPMGFAILAFAVWRATHMLVCDYGPADMFARLREWAGITDLPSGERVAVGGWARLLSCHWCISVWVAAVAAAGAALWGGVGWWALPLWLALAGAAAMLEEVSMRLVQ